MQITIVTGKNSLAPWYHFDGAGTWGRVSLQLGDFRPGSYYVRVYPLESLLRHSFGRGDTDSFFIDVAGVFKPSQIRHFAIKFEKFGIFKDSWVLDGIEFKLDGKIIYKKSNQLAVLDGKNTTFEDELDINNPKIEPNPPTPDKKIPNNSGKKSTPTNSVIPMAGQSQVKVA
ncbi:hypothetical protein K7432_013589 [Basidiobolus ranarum]|uniref:Uncharacterized protein n=1 Tax=Basidiobolus ranarum TaxID=34480 RepID=A0ABR2WJ01_9FUNG